MTNHDKPNPVIISFITLRRVIGILGVSLPAILVLGTFTIGGCDQIQDSISHYYYTSMRDIFVGILCAIAIFLISYYGYGPKDRIVTTLAGIFALLVAFFPTTQNQDPVCTEYFLEPCKIRVCIHYGAAILLFLSLAYISLFLFTKGEKQKGKRKILRNRIYRICGVILLLAVIMIAAVRLTPELEKLLEPYKPVFWIEWLGLVAFGLSWLIKGNVIVKDLVEND